LNGFDDKRLRQLADNAYVALVMHITIAIQRIMEGEVLESDRRLELSLQQDEDYGLAQQIILRLEKEFNIMIPAVELDYILLHIRGSKLKYSDTPEDMSGFSISDEEALDLVDQMIDTFGTDYVYELKCDELLIHGLLVHLQPTLFRLKNDMHIYNPLLEDIQNEYPDIYERCKAVGSLLEKKTGFHINDAEIGYLATHFGAAMVRISKKKTYSRKVSIGIVCASGFGIARLMMTKLSNKLSDSACSLHAFGQEEIGSDVSSDVDFYISSMDLSRLGVDFVYVSPLITAKDLAQIQCKVEEYAHIPKSTANSDITHQLDAITSVSQTIKSVLHNYRLMQFDEDISFDQMLEQISLHMTQNAKRAHQLHMDLQNREDLASQIIPELGIGLLHCRTTAVNEAAVATAVPIETGTFKDPYFKGIQACVILLIPKDDRTKINADLLGSISSSLAEDESFVALVKQTDEEAVRDRLAEILKNHLSSYVAQLG
jgi:transcriptional antiterminator